MGPIGQGEAPATGQSVRLPALFGAADATALAGQRRSLTLGRVSLGLIMVAAVSGISGLVPTKLGGWIAASAFLAALFLELYRLRYRPSDYWYMGRAAAESVKTLAWRYSVGGAPFAVALPGPEADALFVQRLGEILGEMQGVPLIGGEDDEAQITEWMRSLRSSPFEERRETYERLRIRDQRGWYTRRAAWGARQTTRWNLASMALALGGVVLGLLRAAGVVETDLLGLAAAASAAAAAWVQMRQYELLATSYAVAAQELASIGSLIPHQTTEEQWASFVDNSEQAISREHTLWLAKRSDRPV